VCVCAVVSGGEERSREMELDRFSGHATNLSGSSGIAVMSSCHVTFGPSTVECCTSDSGGGPVDGCGLCSGIGVVHSVWNWVARSAGLASTRCTETDDIIGNVEIARRTSDIIVPLPGPSSTSWTFAGRPAAI
jgi:hypothetical protein